MQHDDVIWGVSRLRPRDGAPHRRRRRDGRMRRVGRDYVGGRCSLWALLVGPFSYAACLGLWRDNGMP
eukprot:6200428-Pleurochrysis_carterae.AAC.2